MIKLELLTAAGLPGVHARNLLGPCVGTLCRGLTSE